jgi:hypothetical protein
VIRLESTSADGLHGAASVSSVTGSDDGLGVAAWRFHATGAVRRSKPSTCYLLKLVIKEISGMNSDTTMKPTARPRNTMSRGSMSLVKPSVMTWTSSS